MVTIIVHPSARTDLDALWDDDEDAAAEIETALEEIAADVRLMDHLCRQKFRNDDRPEFDVDLVAVFQRRGLNLYRLKFWDYQGSLISYRVLYAHHAQRDVYHVLAVISRENAYDTEHPLVKRVIADYDRMGLPTYK